MHFTLTIEQLGEAFKAAGIAGEQRERFLRAIWPFVGPRRGRPKEDDADRLFAVTLLVLAGTNPHAAADQVAASLPEPSRTTVGHRLYKKFREQRQGNLTLAEEILREGGRSAEDVLLAEFGLVPKKTP